MEDFERVQVMSEKIEAALRAGSEKSLDELIKDAANELEFGANK